MADDYYYGIESGSTMDNNPKTPKRQVSDVAMSPPGTVSVHELSRLLDIKLKPINDKLCKLDSVTALQNECESLRAENKIIKQELLKQEVFSRKDNIKIFGLKELPNDRCENRLLEIFSYYCNFNDRTFTRVHRLGPKRDGQTRPVLARFHHFKDKIALQRCYHDIYTSGKLRIVDDNPQVIEKDRKLLYPIFKAAEKLHTTGSGQKPKLINNKLYLNGKMYQRENMNDLPDLLQPKYIYTPSRFGITAFFTCNSPLSNHYQSELQDFQFTVDDQNYSSMEQFFMAEKAKQFEDAESLVNIMNEDDPVKVKKLGSDITNYDEEQWLGVCEEKLIVGLLAKFSQNEDLKCFLLSTGKETLVEACTNNTWGIGKTLSSKDLFNKSKWTGKNIMGNLLMQVRDNLKKE